MYDLIIVGGGPAGITAGIYASRKRLKSLIVTKDFIGQTGVAGEIENWPGEKSILGPELMIKLKDHLDEHEIEKIEDRVVLVEKEDGIFSVKTEKGTYKGRAVIFAAGRKPREMQVSGEKDFIGKGVVYCTTCDAPLFKNKRVVVVGGGNAGFESAIELTRYTDKVSLFEHSSSFVADEFLQEKAREKGVNLLRNVTVEGIEGDSFVKKINYKNLKTNESESLDVEGIFVQIGSVPITDSVKGLVELDSGGNIVIDHKTNQTKASGFFAAGDVTNLESKQIVIAAGEGAKAALSAYNYLRELDV